MDQTFAMGDDPDVKRDVVIRLLVNQAERDAIQKAADEDGVSLSEWIRSRCIKTTTTVTVEIAAPDMSDPLHAMTAAQKKRMLKFLAAKPAKKGGL